MVPWKTYLRQGITYHRYNAALTPWSTFAGVSVPVKVSVQLGRLHLKSAQNFVPLKKECFMGQRNENPLEAREVQIN